MILLLAIIALKIQKKFRKVSDKHFYLEEQGYTCYENRLEDEMDYFKKPKKRKFGTTVLEQTDDNISMFKEQHPEEFKTPGEVVDLLRPSVSGSIKARLQSWVLFVRNGSSLFRMSLVDIAMSNPLRSLPTI